MVSLKRQCFKALIRQFQLWLIFLCIVAVWRGQFALAQLVCREQSQQKVKVGVSPTDNSTFPFQSAINNETNPNSFEYQIMEHVFEILQLQWDPIPLKTLGDREDKLINHEVDVVIWQFSVTRDRKLNVQFVEPYYYATYPAMFKQKWSSDTNSTRKGSKDILPQSITEKLRLKPWQLKLCMYPNYFVRDRLESDGYIIIETENHTEMAESVRNSTCDFAIEDQVAARTMQDHGLQELPYSKQFFRKELSPYAIAVSHDSPYINELSFALNELFIKKTRGESSVFLDLETQYLMFNSYADTQLQYSSYLRATMIRQRVMSNAAAGLGILKVGIKKTQAALPYRHYYSELGIFEEETFETQLAHALCRKLRRFCVWVALDELYERESKLQDGSVDMVISTFTANVKRARNVSFIEPLYDWAGVMLYVPKLDDVRYAKVLDPSHGNDWPALVQDMRVAAQPDHYYTEELQKQRKMNLVTEDFATNSELLDAVSGGLTHLMIQDSGFSYQMSLAGLAQLSGAQVKAEMPYGVAVAKWNEELRVDLNEAMRQLAFDGQRSELKELESVYLLQKTGNVMEPSEQLGCQVTLEQTKLSLCAINGN